VEEQNTPTPEEEDVEAHRVNERGNERVNELANERVNERANEEPDVEGHLGRVTESPRVTE